MRPANDGSPNDVIFSIETDVPRGNYPSFIDATDEARNYYQALIGLLGVVSKANVTDAATPAPPGGKPSFGEQREIANCVAAIKPLIKKNHVEKAYSHIAERYGLKTTSLKADVSTMGMEDRKPNPQLYSEIESRLRDAGLLAELT